MVKNRYIPDRGDLVWLNFSPSFGHEEAGRRPALTLSPKKYNSKTNMAIFCPITRSIKSYPFEVEIVIGKEKSAVLTDQIRALDWSKRKCEFVSKISEARLSEVQDKILELIKG